MYLSRLKISPKSRKTMRALAWPKLIHGAVENALQRDDTRKLWRIDWLENNCYLLILSHEKPDLASISEQFTLPDDGSQAQTKCYDGVLEKLAVGQVWRFRITANPVHCVKNKPDDKRGVIKAHVTQEQQRQWLLSKAERAGFKLDEVEFDVVHSEWKCFPKHANARHDVRLRMATFEGGLTVIDVEDFRKTLSEGLGRARAYGCGMMTIMAK